MLSERETGRIHTCANPPKLGHVLNDMKERSHGQNKVRKREEGLVPPAQGYTRRLPNKLEMVRNMVSPALFHAIAANQSFSENCF